MAIQRIIRHPITTSNRVFPAAAAVLLLLTILLQQEQQSFHVDAFSTPFRSANTPSAVCSNAVSNSPLMPKPQAPKSPNGSKSTLLFGKDAKQEDKDLTYKVIMDHIADIEDKVEKKGVGGKASQQKDFSAASSSRNPFKNLKSKSPADGKNRLVFMLAFMTGVADVAMVLKYKNFATMMTGNTMWMASHTLERNFGLAFYLLAVIASYMGGLAGFRRVYLSLKEQSLELFAPMVAAAFLAADQLSYLNPAKKFLPMCILSAAFGIINAVGTDMAGTLCFVVTGHMSRITNAIVDRISGLAGKKKIDSTAMIRSTSVCVGFFLGAFAAWAGVKRFPSLKERGLLSLMGTVYGGLFLWQDAKNMGGWWKHKAGTQCEIDEYDATCA